MKKILLIIAITLLIFQMVVLAVAIDIGSAAIERPFNTVNVLKTYVDKNNPANASGTITSIEIWASTNLANCEVATFYIVSGNNLSTRDTHTIGSVTAGNKQTFSGLDITVQTGDYIGLKYTRGQLEKTDSGDGYWYINSDEIPCTNVLFTSVADTTISLYGTGTTVEAVNALFFGTNF